MRQKALLWSKGLITPDKSNVKFHVLKKKIDVAKFVVSTRGKICCLLLFKACKR